MLRSAKDILASGDIGAVVDLAIEVNRTAQVSTKDLSSVKEWLRGLAKDKKRLSPEVTHVSFEGQLGVVQVVIPSKPFVRVRKGMNPADLKKVLTQEEYESLFVEKTVIEPTSEYRKKLATLDQRKQLMVKNYVGVTPAVSRVNIPE